MVGERLSNKALAAERKKQRPLKSSVRRLSDRVGRVKLLLKIGGISSILVGLMCLPIGYGVSPKRDLSTFANLADMGVLLKVSLLLVVVGAAILVASWLVPGEEPEDLL
jgi:hypothetical protein